MSLKQRISTVFSMNKPLATVLSIIIVCLFLFALFMTINGFSGGALTNGSEAPEIYKIGANKYGTMYYEGEFVDKQLSGEGTLTIQGDGRNIILSGLFSDNRFVQGVVTIINADGSEYSATGTFENNELTKGYKVFATAEDDITVYEGTFVNRLLHGRGQAQYTFGGENEGLSYAKVGTFENGIYVE